ncbi:MAG: hypothetical protein V2I46_10790 [Bacteroides sp.]|jgi:outer membrane lipoprotein-sorting protein|nr:hypothetical protein [Bacteroides sp.]
MKHRLPLIVLLVISFATLGFHYLSVERIMMEMESQSLHRGKRADVQASLFYQSLDGRLVTRYTQPVEQVMITNNKGELAIFNEQDYTVYRTQSLEYSSENNLIYFFLQGKTSDLGLQQMGFQLMDTRFEDGMVVTQWFPPSGLYHLFSQIELVHENYLPIYTGYYDTDKKLVKKVYYTDYRQFPEITLPMTITEFNYLPGGDSIVNRVKFSEVQINQRAVSPWFNFSIPHDAKILE